MHIETYCKCTAVHIVIGTGYQEHIFKWFVMPLRGSKGSTAG